MNTKLIKGVAALVCVTTALAMSYQSNPKANEVQKNALASKEAKDLLITSPEKSSDYGTGTYRIEGLVPKGSEVTLFLDRKEIKTFTSNTEDGSYLEDIEVTEAGSHTLIAEYKDAKGERVLRKLEFKSTSDTNPADSNNEELVANGSDEGNNEVVEATNMLPEDNGEDVHMQEDPNDPNNSHRRTENGEEAVNSENPEDTTEPDKDVVPHGKPVVKDPHAKPLGKPVVKDAHGKPIAKKPAVKPVAKDAHGKPIVKKPPVKPVAKDPHAKVKPVVDAHGKPVAKKPAVKNPHAKPLGKPVVKDAHGRPIAKKPPVKPVAKDPHAKPTANKKPVAKKPTGKKGAPKKPAAFALSSHSNFNVVPHGTLQVGGRGKPGDKIVLFVDNKPAMKGTIKPNGRWKFPIKIGAAGYRTVTAQNLRTKEVKSVKLKVN